MEEMLWRRRVAVAASVLALGGFGVAAAGCGDENGDSEDIEKAAEDAVQEGEEAAEDAGDAADEAADDAGEAVEGAEKEIEDDDEASESEKQNSDDDGY
jgi:hypothetical protein